MHIALHGRYGVQQLHAYGLSFGLLCVLREPLLGLLSYSVCVFACEGPEVHSTHIVTPAGRRCIRSLFSIYYFREEIA